MMRIWKQLGLGLGLLTLVAMSLVSCRRCRTPEERVAKMTARITSRLNLTADQQSKLKAVGDEWLAAGKNIRSARQAAIDELIQEVQAPQLDSAKLQSLFTQRQQAFAELAPAVIAKMADFHRSLNDNQKAKVADFLKHIREKTR
jgi:hypothetical protein